MWGASASLGKAAFKGLLAGEHAQTPIDVVILAQTRTTFSLLILAPALLLVFGKQIFRMSRRDFLLALLMGAVGLVGANFFYYYGIDKTSVATAITLQYTAPIWVLLYMVTRRLQHATAQRVGGVVLAFVGVVLSLGVLKVASVAPFIRLQGLHWDTLGLLASVGAAFSFSFYNILGSTLVSRNGSWKVFVYALCGAVMFWLIANPPTRIVAAHYSGGQWLFLLLFAIVSMLIPFAFYLAGLRYLDATRAVVTACLEPVFAILIAIAFLGEQPGWAQAIGMAMVLAATVLVQMPERR
jgi:drug/metabolite transporter (DMT)-like permease